MNEQLTLPVRRLITPMAAFLLGVALLAAVALGFGLRAWTENGTSSSSSSSTSGVAPTHQTLNARDEAVRRISAAHRRAATTEAAATTAPRALRLRSHR